MDMRGALKGQYHAALAMLREAMEECPKEVWEAKEGGVAYWHVVYHTLFFTHLYLMKNSRAFKPWAKSRKGYQGFRCAKVGKVKAYTKRELVEYWRWCDKLVDGAVEGIDLDAAHCGFHWYSLNKLEHQINNIRHIQHHAALLAGRLRRAQGISVRWVGGK